MVMETNNRSDPGRGETERLAIVDETEETRIRKLYARERQAHSVWRGCSFDRRVLH